MTGSAPRVGIGFPVYNAERYLEHALESILAQTWTDFELVISDNASTDRTAEVCLDYAARDRRIRYSRNERNLGASPNFNRAFVLSSAEYFKWAPYDDLIAPEFLATCVQVLDDDAEVVLCYAKAKIIDQHGEFVVDYDPGPCTASVRPHERFRNLILHPEYALQALGLIRRSVLEKTTLLGSFPSADEVLLAELALRGRFHQCPERLYIYRRHPEQSTMREATQRRRVLFFDTSLEGRVVLPTWRYLGACLRAVARVPLDGAEKARCYAHVLRWALVPSHYRALGKDVLLAAGRTIGRLSTGRRATAGVRGRPV
jgi:glycosyltransferase involved in cell wall biosynthesis